jgi:hypothetical protein
VAAKEKPLNPTAANKKGFRGFDQHGPLFGFGEAKKDVYAGVSEHKIIPLAKPLQNPPRLAAGRFTFFALM